WIASQYGGGPGANTILPFNVWLHCDSNSYSVRIIAGQCVDMKYQSADCDCPDPAKAPGAPPTNKAGDPVNIQSGNLIEWETDYASGDGLFAVKRRYSSSHLRQFSDPPVGFGETWQGLIPSRLLIQDANMNAIGYGAGNGESQHNFTADVNDINSWTYTPPLATRATLTLITTPTQSRNQYFAGAAIPNGPAEFRLAFANGEFILYR